MKRFWFVLAAAAAWAHPMGNFSVSHYTRFDADANGVSVTYALDLAELPSFELLQKWGVAIDAPVDVLRAKAAEEATGWVRDGALQFSRGTPRLMATEVIRADGAGAMAVLRITARYRLEVAPGVLEFQDRVAPDRAGWKEIVIRGEGVTRASHGTEDRSQALTAYPQDVANPPQDLRARFEWSAVKATSRVLDKLEQPAGKTPEPVTIPQQRPKDRLSRLVGDKELSGWPLLAALGLAFALGCAHALTPGHGKTMVAAYLVGERGTPLQALLLGAVTTFTHTISVFALGLATYFLAGSFAPEKVTRILELISGLAIALLGLSLLYKRVLHLSVTGGRGHGHAHHYDDPEPGIAGLIALGASGGLVPCPSALVLLLTSIALGRVATGLLLLVSFSIGLAVVLVTIGLTVVYAKNVIPKGLADHPVRQYIPIFSAGVITAIGIFLTASSLGWVRFTGSQ